MYIFKDREIIENFLFELTNLLNDWGISPDQWIINDKFFFTPYLHDHPSSQFYRDLEIIINEDFVPWEINKNNSGQFIPPPNSKYLNDYLSFMNRFKIEVNFFYDNNDNFKDLSQKCSLLKVKGFNIKQRKPYFIIKKVLSNVIKKIQEKNKGLEELDCISINQLPVNNDLALYLHLGYMYSKDNKDLKLFKLINDLFLKRTLSIEAHDFVNNLKTQGIARFIFDNKIIEKINKNIILVTNDLSSKDIPLIIKAGGIICERGGINNHLAIICREFNIPCVVGVKDIYNKFREGDLIELLPEEKIIKILKPYK